MMNLITLFMSVFALTISLILLYKLQLISTVRFSNLRKMYYEDENNSKVREIIGTDINQSHEYLNKIIDFQRKGLINDELIKVHNTIFMFAKKVNECLNKYEEIQTVIDINKLKEGIFVSTYYDDILEFDKRIPDTFIDFQRKGMDIPDLFEKYLKMVLTAKNYKSNLKKGS